LNETKTSAKLK